MALMTTAAVDAAAASGWLHVTVIVVALSVLVPSLVRHNR
ncbi:UNVERIFIED_CONTAM: hypothetical protein RKD43_006015 [Streptomyces graminofaciens]